MKGEWGPNELNGRKFNMDQTIEKLMERLEEKGVEPMEIPAFTATFANIVSGDPFLSLKELNRRMGVLGWRHSPLDDYTLRLVMIILADSIIGSDPGKRLWFETGSHPGKVIPLHDAKSYGRNRAHKVNARSGLRSGARERLQDSTPGKFEMWNRSK